MAEERSSIGTIVLAVLAIAVIGGALVEPWFHFDQSSGRKTAPGGPQPADDTRVERHELTYFAFKQTGDATPTHPEDAAREIRWIGQALWAAIGLLALVILGEVPGIHKWVPRLASMGTLVLALGAVAIALYIGWFQLPRTLDGFGVTSPFTSRLAEPWYVITTLKWGWVAAAASIPFTLGAVLWRFQAGSDELTLPTTSAPRGG